MAQENPSGLAIKALFVAVNQGKESKTERLSQILADSEEVLKAKIEIEKNACAKLHKGRPVPYVICPIVEAELENLEQTGILPRVDWSEWATPIVPLMKKNHKSKSRKTRQGAHMWRL